MQYADPHLDWTEWVSANPDQDEATKLLALREYIAATARDWQDMGEITAEWANKKLTALGITELIGMTTTYLIQVPVSGTAEIGINAGSRVEALKLLEARLVGTRQLVISAAVALDTPVFTSGPEDPDPSVIDPDVPTTVQATLDMLREIILLGHIAGPKYCDIGANKVLASYGLAPIPERKKFTVTRPVAADMRTVVEAYDEVSAQRVAGWRWDNGRTGYEVFDVDPIDEATVTAADNVASATAAS